MKLHIFHGGSLVAHLFK